MTSITIFGTGNMGQAIAGVLARGGAGEAPFRALDSALSQLISESREATRAYIDDSLNATRLVSLVVAVLSILAVLCIWAGIRPRLGEYL